MAELHNGQKVAATGTPPTSSTDVVIPDEGSTSVAVASSRDTVEGCVPGGRHEVEWDAGDLPSGVYLVRMQASSFSQVRRMTLVK